MVEKGAQPVVKQRQPVLHALVSAAGCHRLVQGIIKIDAAELGGVARAKAAHGGIGQVHFARRQNSDPSSCPVVRCV